MKKPTTTLAAIDQFLSVFAGKHAIYVGADFSPRATTQLCNTLSLATPGLGSLWTDYCAYLQSVQPRPQNN
jgi:hypothetical protein